jgi:NAD(P)H-hydrate epimerase
MAGWRRGRGRVQVVASEADVERLATRLGQAAAVVDALLGTGLASPVVGLMARVVDAVNAAGAPVLAVDMPTGVSADTGQVLGTAVRADATATFAFCKVGHCQYPGASLAGTVSLVGIGIPDEAVETAAPRGAIVDATVVAALVPRRPPGAHKGLAGHVLVVAGGPGKVGAALLAAEAAARSGAGLVTLAVPASLQARVDGRVPEVMTTALPEDADGGAAPMHAAAIVPWLEPYRAVVCGPGLGTRPEAAALAAQVLESAVCPVVLDADGLNAVAETQHLARRDAPTIVTPHPGEMARLLGSSVAAVQADRVGVARRLAGRDRVVVVLKGARTIVAEPSGEYGIAVAGNPGMASGGMGDVLAGIVGALVGQGLEPADAARLGVHVHAAAADGVAAARGEIGLLARDVIAALPPTLAATASAGAEPGA